MRFSRLLRLSCVCALVWAGWMMPSNRVHADAAIAVTISTVDLHFPFVIHEILVANPGSEPLEAVTIVPGGDLVQDTLTDRNVIAGNADDVLDPGEQWSYQCRSQISTGSVSVEVSASTATGATVEASDILGYSPEPPQVGVTITSNTLVANSGDIVEWTLEITNQSPHDLEYATPTATLWAGLTTNDGPEPITGPIPMTLTDQASNGDNIGNPGETWTWVCSAAVTVDGTYLRAMVSVSAAGSGGPFGGFGVNSDSITVGAPGTTTPETPSPPIATSPDTTVAAASTLPATGAGTTSTERAALALLILGAGLVVVTRRGSSTRR